ncbi:uncharacterized protein LOC115758761 [Drosophila novamexicana]|uniref:uncharacterized protein LOC115758761 n=1 Tax=Drosophila novamexicana TaxID=47314 RepID=UPI0011E5D83F|nr:uncharacterized protein LOC115758761 [Drosophila novamexicana]
MWRLVLLLSILQSAYTSPITPCEKLHTVMVLEITAFTKKALNEGVELLQRVIDNAELLELSDIDQITLAQFAEFIESRRHAVDSEELEDLLEELVELLDMEDVSQELDECENPVAKLLRQYGFDTFEKNLEKQLRTFIERTEYHVEAYLKRQNAKDSELPTWFTEFQNENDIESKYLMFLEVLEHIEC